MMTDQDDRSHEGEASRREAIAWLTHLSSGEATDADAEALKRWCDESPAHAAAFAEANLLWSVLGPAAQSVAARAAARKLPQRPSIATRRTFFGAAGAAAAASIGYLIVRPPFELWPSISELAAQYRTGTGERRQLAMADGAAVDMNTRTSLNLEAASGGASRIELIAGEAVVTTGANAAKPVVVAAAAGRTSASSAKFDIRCDGGAVCVTCLEGTVDVAHRGSTAVVRREQQVVYDDGGIGQVVSVDSTVVTSWQINVLIFRQEPLSLAIEEINRYRPGRIVLVDATLGRKLIDASFRLDRIEDILPQIVHVFGARARTLPGGIVLLG
jgi:transmembrane sensor